MTRKRNAAWYGLALLLGVSLVGACGGMEIDDAQFESGQADLEFEHATLDSDNFAGLAGPAHNPYLVPRVPKAKRPWNSDLKRPAQRPPRPGDELADPAQRNPLVRCGDDDLVDLMWDPNHCGACFNACATSQCVEGACTATTFGR